MLTMLGPELHHLFPGPLADWLHALGRILDRERRRGVVEGAD